MYLVKFPIKNGIPQLPDWFNKSWDATVFCEDNGGQFLYLTVEQAASRYRKIHNIKLNINPYVKTSIDSAEFQTEDVAVMFMLRWA